MSTPQTVPLSGPDAATHLRVLTEYAEAHPPTHTCAGPCALCDAEEPPDREPVSGWSADRAADAYYEQLERQAGLAPTAQDSAQSGGGYNGQTNVTLTDATVRQPARWGEYEPAIRRWERVLGRPAPEPTKLNAKGNPKLSDEFDEWHMGLPAGWITDVPGVTWNEALKACGNGVVPQQGAAALRWLLAMAWGVAS